MGTLWVAAVLRRIVLQSQWAMAEGISAKKCVLLAIVSPALLQWRNPKYASAATAESRRGIVAAMLDRLALDRTWRGHRDRARR
jgi:hypothetical protein